MDNQVPLHMLRVIERDGLPVSAEDAEHMTPQQGDSVACRHELRVVQLTPDKTVVRVACKYCGLDIWVPAVDLERRTHD